VGAEKRAREVVRRLTDGYPDAVCELDYDNPWQLLVATVLSAQCTDERVNTVTPILFERWPDATALAGAAQEDLEEVIRPTGFFRNKARNLRLAARRVVVEHDGDVPTTLDQLVSLPGVGRKTAKVVLGEGFGIPAGITVDTHVHRLSRRLDLADHRDPEKVATALEKLVPKDEWVRFSLRVIVHGRRVCSARRPMCDGRCVLSVVCPRVGV